MIYFLVQHQRLSLFRKYFILRRMYKRSKSVVMRANRLVDLGQLDDLDLMSVNYHRGRYDVLSLFF